MKVTTKLEPFLRGLDKIDITEDDLLNLPVTGTNGEKIGQVTSVDFAEGLIYIDIYEEGVIG